MTNTEQKYNIGDKVKTPKGEGIIVNLNPISINKEILIDVALNSTPKWWDLFKSNEIEVIN